MQSSSVPVVDAGIDLPCLGELENIADEGIELPNHTNYWSVTSVLNKTILENLKKLSYSQDQITIRFPIISGLNVSDGDVSQTGEFVCSLEKVDGIDILPYHKFGIEKYNRLGMRSYGLSVKVGG
jgi:hypothetical protein